MYAAARKSGSNSPLGASAPQAACDERPQSPANSGEKPQKDPARVLGQLHRLQDDCAHLNDLIERMLLNSGICRRYTHPGELVVCNLRQQRGGGGEVELERPAGRESAEWRSRAMNREWRERSREPSNQRSRSPAPRRPLASRPVRAYSVGRSRFFFVRTEPSFDRYTLAAFQRIRPPAGRHKPQKKWIPRITIPQPFRMTIREQYTRTKSTYSKRFLQSLLREKHRKELAELREHEKKFKAHPVPPTTYKPDLPAKIGVLKRRSKSATIPKRMASPKRPFRSTAVPLSTFVRPFSGEEERRKERRFERALSLLAAASEPGRMADHSTRWQIQQKLRHEPRCFQRTDETERVRSKSVPDFKLLHYELEAKLQDLRLERPITLTEPFRFHLDYPKHYCKAWTMEQERRAERKKMRA
ncbi:hypothetical protein M3Y99_01919200 [Aphelenchoides fujianensis]|nr:hypothetical protein M3Y99_01919200 [Aphelenchoides fujianensis]